MKRLSLLAVPVLALLSANCTSTSGGSGGAGGSTASGGSGPTGGTLGEACGQAGGVECAADEYCEFESTQCGVYYGPGTCTKRPEACGDVYQPTCGCDGKTYGSECGAHAAGVDRNTLGGCPPPAGMFPCGSGFCALDSEYCVATLSDYSGPTEYACHPLPAACGSAPVCGCLAGEACADNCTVTTEGGLQTACAWPPAP